MANPGVVPTVEQSQLASRAVRACGLTALAKASSTNEVTASRVAAGARAQRATIAAVVGAAERLLASANDPNMRKAG